MLPKLCHSARSALAPMQSTPFRPEFLRKSSAERNADSWRQSLRSLDVGFRASTDTGLALPTDIRRGATLAAVLLRFGSAFRHHPERLDAADKAALYARSRPVERLDAFVSHSWSSPGYQKYLSLLFAEVSRISLAAAAAGGFAVYLLQHRRQELLPGNFVVEAAFSPLFLLPQVTSPYEFLAANLLALLSFAAAPALLTRRCYFVDCLCIHQTDHDLKLRGIRHLGGFLSRSSKLVVLWDESYFRRLWCIYEIAVFKAVHPEARAAAPAPAPTPPVGPPSLDSASPSLQAPVQLHPLRLSVATALLASFFVLGAGLYVGIYPYVAPFGIGTFYAASFSCSAVVFGGSAVAGHDFARQRSALVEHLSAFDARSARCYCEADRAEIVVAIERMCGGRRARRGGGESGVRSARPDCEQVRRDRLVQPDGARQDHARGALVAQPAARAGPVPRHGDGRGAARHRLLLFRRQLVPARQPRHAARLRHVYGHLRRVRHAAARRMEPRAGVAPTAVRRAGGPAEILAEPPVHRAAERLALHLWPRQRRLHLATRRRKHGRGRAGGAAGVGRRRGQPAAGRRDERAAGARVRGDVPEPARPAARENFRAGRARQRRRGVGLEV